MFGDFLFLLRRKCALSLSQVPDYQQQGEQTCLQGMNRPQQRTQRPVFIFVLFVQDRWLCFPFQQVIFAVCASCFSILPHPYLRASPSFTPPSSFQTPSFSALFPLLQLWRLSLALVVTVFISGILEGLRRDETHSFVGGVKKKKRKKKKGPVQYSTLSAVP